MGYLDGDSAGAAGQLMIIGFDGDRYTRDLGAMFGQINPAGVILFARNIKTPGQTKTLVKDIRALLEDVTGSTPFVCLDQEGGRVSRLPGYSYPTARELCAKGEQEVELAYKMMGDFMFELGFNVDFAPVLDLDTNPANPIIGDRAFAPDAQTVIQMANAAKRGLAAANILSCGKHFPGHGGADKDSHLELPVDPRPMERFLDQELAPFEAWAREEGPFIMTAHVSYPALDPTMLPATLSKPIITGLLRERLGYNGVVVTDDMDMKALADNHDDRDAVLMALNAGCDILLGCHNPQRIRSIHQTLRFALDGALPENLMIPKLARVMEQKITLM